MRERKIKLTCDCCGSMGLVDAGEGVELRFGEHGGKLQLKGVPVTLDYDICDECSERIVAFLETLRCY